jgi:hypothetical protein
LYLPWKRCPVRARRYAEAELLDGILEDQVEAIPVVGVEEDRITGVAAEDNVVDSTGIMDAGFTGHGRSIAANVRKSDSGDFPRVTLQIIWNAIKKDNKPITYNIEQFCHTTGKTEFFQPLPFGCFFSISTHISYKYI